MTDKYHYMGWGNCLGGIAPHTSAFEVDPNAPIKVGDIVALAPKPEWAKTHWGRCLDDEGLLGLTKIYLGREEIDGEVVHYVGCLVPTTVMPVPDSAIGSMHAISGVSYDHVDKATVRAEADDRAAMALLGHLCGTVGHIPPSTRPGGLLRLRMCPFRCSIAVFWRRRQARRSARLRKP